MDSITNIPLLDEDDSLLFDDSAPATADVFSCSPLIPLRSNPPQTECGVADSENRSSSVNDSANKENADWNKPQKLSLEPHQMKRKKKGGGYNLRKSLAWNRAFFTEEGVLNPEELSMISGTGSAKTGLDLEVIHEEEYVGTSIKLQEIEENLFMHSPDAVPVEDRKIGATSRFSPKPAALAKASPAPAKRKILTVNDSVGNRPKRNACPPRLPVASSSLKRPNTVKAPTKEVKIARTPGPKLDVSASTTTARSGILTAGFSKRNQNAHPATNLQKHAGVKSLSKNPKTIPSNPKVGPADKRPVTRALAKRAEKHLDNSVETHPPPRMLQSGTEANKVSEACLPQGVSDIGEKKQATQLQTTKLSGLRMPSPSLGFFSMAKAPGSHSQLQKISKPCKPAKSNIPKLQNLETKSVNEARLQHAPVIRSEIVKGKNCTEELSLLAKSELSMQVEYNSVGSEKISKQKRVENILDHVNITYKEHGELHRSENASSVEDAVFPRHEKKLLSESQTQEQLEKEADQHDVLSKGYRSVLQEPPSMHYRGMQGTSIVKGSISNTVHSGMGQDEDEQTKLLACDILTSNESLVLQGNHSTSFKDSRLSGEFNKYNSVKTALLNSSLIDFRETVLEGSIQEIPSKRSTEQVNGGAADLVKSGGDAQKRLLIGNLSVNCSETTRSNLEAVNQQLQVEQLKTTSASVVGEIMSTKGSESRVNSCRLVHMTNLSSEGSPKSIPEIKCAAAGEPKVAKIEGCHLSVNDQSGFIQTIPVLEQCDMIIDSKAMDHSTQSEDCITVSSTACNTEVRNVSQESRPFHENNVQNLLLTSQLCPMVKADFVSSENEMSTNKSCRISELQLRDEDSSRDASIHYDVPCDVPGNFEQQTSKITNSEANKMLCEDESLVLNHGHLLDQREFCEVSADIISNTKDSIGFVAEKSSSCSQHTLLTRLVREVDHTNREIRESHVEDAQMQLLNENPAPYESNNPKNGNNILHSDGDCLPTNIASSVEIKKAVEDMHARSFNENPAPLNCNSKHCLVTNDTDFQRPGAVGAADSDNFNSILLHLNGDRLSKNVASSEEIKKTDLFEGALCDIHRSEHNASHNHIQAMPEKKDGNIRMDDLVIDDAKEGYSDILPLVEFQRNDNIHTISENKDGNLDMDDAKEGSSDILPLVEVELDDNIQAMPENNDRCLDMDDAKEGSSDILPLVEVQLDDNIQAMPENIERYLDIDDLQMDDAKVGSSDILLSIEVQLIDNIQAFSENNDENLDMDDAKEGSFDVLPLVEVQLGDSIQAMSENNERNLDMDDLQMDHTKEGSSDMLPLAEEVQVNDNIRDVNDANLDMDDSKECSSDILPLVEVQFIDNIQAISENNDENLDMDDAKEGSSDILPLVEVQLDDNIQAMSENNERSLDIDDLQMDDAKEDSSDMLPLVEVQLIDNIEATSGNNDENLEMDDAKEGSSDILPLVEVQVNDNVISSELIYSSAVNTDSFADVVAWKSEERCCLSGSSNLPASDHLSFNLRIPKVCELSSLNSEKILDEFPDTGDDKASNDHIPAIPENEDGNLYADAMAEHLHMDDAKKSSSGLLPLVEVQFNDNVVSSECNSFIEVSKDSCTHVVAWKLEEHRSSESSSLPASDNLTSNTRIPQVCEISLLNTKAFLEEAGTNIFKKDESPNTDMEHQSKGDIYYAEDSDKIIHLQESVTKSKQEVPKLKPPPNAAPFSDEWLAAIEAAGEEILTMKGGAVQNSPTDKPQHEPGPWSPVRRKNQSIGPFDCTKHNIQHSSP